MVRDPYAPVAATAPYTGAVPYAGASAYTGAPPYTGAYPGAPGQFAPQAPYGMPGSYPAMGYPGWRPAPRFRAVRGLAIALYALLPLNAVFAVLSAIAFFHRADVLQQIADTGANGMTVELDQRATDSDALVAAGVGFLGLSVIATGVLFIIWMHRARSNVDLFGPSKQHLHVGWTIGGWFLPLANLWFPKLILHDVWRASDARTAERGGRTPGRHPLLWTWWVLLVGSAVLFFASRISYPRTIELDDANRLKTIDILSGAADIVLVFAALAAIFVVRKITRFQQEREAFAYASVSGGVPGAGGAPWGGYHPQAPTGRFQAPQAPTAPGAPTAQGAPPVPMAPGMTPEAAEAPVAAAAAVPEGDVAPSAASAAPARPDVAPAAAAATAAGSVEEAAEEPVEAVSLTKPVEAGVEVASVGADAVEVEVDAGSGSASVVEEAAADAIVEPEPEPEPEPADVVVAEAGPVVSFDKSDVEADGADGAEVADVADVADAVGDPEASVSAPAQEPSEDSVDGEAAEAGAEVTVDDDVEADDADSAPGARAEAPAAPVTPEQVAPEDERVPSGDRRG